MFNWIGMINNYEDRKVSHNDFEWGMIDTARVEDGNYPFETVVEHIDYNDGNMVIVEAYNTIGEAKKGHKRWVKIMSAKFLPKSLKDCNNASISQIAAALGCEMEFSRKVK